jgi:regulator of protease activity HflC (stomatin/prohibitin superfamily)
MTDEQASGEQEAPVNGNAVRVNGSAVKVNGTVPDEPVAPIAGVEDLAWRPSYDRESVDQYLAAVEAEKVRLLAEIRLAEERTAAAQERYQVNATERDALLGALLLAAREEVDRVDAEHRTTVAAIRAEAEEEAARIRDRAQADATAVRDVVASLTGLTGTGEPADDADPAPDDERHVD